MLEVVFIIIAAFIFDQTAFSVKENHYGYEAEEEEEKEHALWLQNRTS